MSALDNMTEEKLETIFNEKKKLEDRMVELHAAYLAKKKELEDVKQNYKELQNTFLVQNKECIALNRRITSIETKVSAQFGMVKEAQRLLMEQVKVFRTITKLSSVLIE